MFKLKENQMVVPNMHLLTLEAPEVARQIKPGQFVIVRAEEGGERIPCVLIRGAPVTLIDESPEMPKISMEGCMYFGNVIKTRSRKEELQKQEETPRRK